MSYDAWKTANDRDNATDADREPTEVEEAQAQLVRWDIALKNQHDITGVQGAIVRRWHGEPVHCECCGATIRDGALFVAVPIGGGWSELCMVAARFLPGGGWYDNPREG